MSHRRLVAGLVALVLAGALPGLASASDARTGFVYTETNASSGNAVMAFARAGDGSLTSIGSFTTGGLGTGAGLATQGEVILAGGGRWLLAVNAGSNDISVFRVHADGSLTLTDRAAAAGTRPVSLSAAGDIVYVLDAGGAGNVAAFALDGGELSFVSGSIRPLSGGATNPAEVAASPNGRFVVVTERATNLIDTYLATPDGRLSGPTETASSGPTPYGFAFDLRNDAIVSEAANSALSSYRVSAAGAHVVSASIPTGGLAACWVAVSPSGDWAFTTNAHGGTISSFAVGANGSIALVQSVAADTGAGSGPLDLAVTSDGTYLYVNESGAHRIGEYAIGGGGSLTPLAGSVSLPSGASGLAVS